MLSVHLKAKNNVTREKIGIFRFDGTVDKGLNYFIVYTTTIVFLNALAITPRAQFLFWRFLQERSEVNQN